jgi:hypothetical protein
LTVATSIATASLPVPETPPCRILDCVRVRGRRVAVVQERTRCDRMKAAPADVVTEATTQGASMSSDRSAQRGSQSVGAGEDTDGEGVRLARSAARSRRAKAHRPAGGAEPRVRPIRSVVAGLHRPAHHEIIEPIQRTTAAGPRRRGPTAHPPCTAPGRLAPWPPSPPNVTCSSDCSPSRTA